MQQNKLFVGNLSFTTTSAELESAFAQFGGLEEVKVITDRETGRSRGFGFVTFVNQHDAETALAMNGKELNGRSLRVNMATEKAPTRGPRPGGSGGGGYGGPRKPRF